MFAVAGATMTEPSRRTVLDSFVSSSTGATVSLVHRTAGYEPAGSLCRDACEAWGSLYQTRDGTRGGQWFLTEAEARQRFNTLKARD